MRGTWFWPAKMSSQSFLKTSIYVQAQRLLLSHLQNTSNIWELNQNMYIELVTSWHLFTTEEACQTLSQAWPFELDHRTSHGPEIRKHQRVGELRLPGCLFVKRLFHGIWSVFPFFQNSQMLISFSNIFGALSSLGACVHQYPYMKVGEIILSRVQKEPGQRRAPRFSAALECGTSPRRHGRT